MNIGVIGNSAKASLPEAVGELLKLGPKYDLHFFIHSELNPALKNITSTSTTKINFCDSDSLVKEVELIIAFGGDGTILSTARIVGSTQIPILGINLGKLGFLADASLNELDLYISTVVQKQHVVEMRSVLRMEPENDDYELYALNEIVIDKSSSSRLIPISIYVNNDYLVSFHGDGIIVSTPTGSTGYALAAGGPIVSPATDVIVLQPISPHSLSARTVIIPDSSQVRIAVGQLSDQARVTVDGQQEKTIIPPANIFIQRAEYRIKLIKKNDRSYYDVLRAKLMWGSDIRLPKSEGK